MKLFFREFGSGIPLVILHGLYGSSDNWISIARELSDSFRVILPDQRNHGTSPHHELHSYDSMSEDLNELMEELSIKHFFLAGHSMGGKTAMWYASRWPDKLAGLMIIDISPFKQYIEKNLISGFHKKVLQTYNSLELSSLGSRDEADNMFAKEIDSPRIRSFLLKNLTRDENRKFRWKLNAVSLENNLENILDGFSRNDASENSISGFPVTFVRADESGYIPESDFADISLLFPAAEIVSIENTSHWIHAEKPEIIIDLILRLVE